MKIPFQSRSRSARFLNITLSLGLGLASFGALVLPPVAAAAASVTVDQQPLTVRPAIPPNIVLMLDDSGSMNWDIMPDYDYLADTTQGGLTNAAINGVYYNPTITYALPPHSDSTLYPASDFAAAPVNGFDTASATVDLSLYRGRYDSNDTQYEASAIQYSVALKTTAGTAYAANPSCLSGWGNSGKYPGWCSHDSDPGASVWYNFYDTDNHYFYRSKCNAITDVYDASAGKCYPGISFFVYTTGPQGNYTTHFVPKTTGDCSLVTLPANGVCDDDNATRQNVANWFSYYHTRLLMAKSGLMSAFLGMSDKYRFGFGSINGNNNGNLPSPNATFGGKKLAEVQPFGNGAPGTQKANFWNWAATASAGSSTPLLAALQAVGKYYQDAQPWTSMASDPGYVEDGDNPPLACRASYTILTTDGFWNPGITGIGNVDGNDGSTVTGPNAQSYQYLASDPYQDNYADTLADVAMKYWMTDLQPSLSNEVPKSTEDPAFWQHMVTFTMGMGFLPVNIDPAGTTVDQIFAWANGGAPISGFGWPQPSGASGGSVNNIADLAHAGLNGHGAFFSVTNPEAFTTGLKAALKRVNERVGTGASAAANSTQLQNGTVLYQANYFTGTWKGDLKALAVDPDTGAVATVPTWLASQQLPAAPAREIQTFNPSSGTFVEFKNGGALPPDLSSAQLSALGGTAAEQEAMVDYLRGDASQEVRNGGTFRDRVDAAGNANALGDIVSSQPAYNGIAEPDEFANQSFYGTSSFHDWAVGTTDAFGNFTPSAASQRTPVIYVAANDGMLHGFNADTGAEVYAYLPGAVITAGLKNLSAQDYGDPGNPHQFYNDGQVTIAEAYLPSLPQIHGSSWHTILVGTTGRGLAKAVYAIDVTDPAAITPLWERSAGDGEPGSDYIGQMVGRPVIAQTNATASSSTWSVLMGNGYNSAQGVSALLQFNLVTGDLDVHETTDATSGNGLAGPLVWLDNPSNGVSTVAYAGDLHGHVWSFALNDTTGTNPTPTSTGALLFTAVDGSGVAQPITAGMMAGRDPTTGNVWLFFGTGEYLNLSDLANTDTQTWYGIIVQSSDATLVTNLANGRSALVQRTITDEDPGNPLAIPPVLPARTISEQTDPNDMNGKSGWYIDLLTPSNAGPLAKGERMVDPNQLYGGLLIGTTRIPQATDVCNPSGTGWVMAIDPYTGAATDDFFDVNGNGSIDSGDRFNGNPVAGIGFGSLPNSPIFVGSHMYTTLDSGNIANVKTHLPGAGGARVDWRELVNP